MILFFEGYHYSRNIVEDYVSDRYFSPLKDGNTVKIDYTGYFYNSAKGVPVFILPKVFCPGDKAFGIDDLSPEEALDLQKCKGKIIAKGWNEKMLFELPLWIYRAISVYKDKYKDTDICETEDYLNVLKSANDKESSLMDIILSLVELYKKDKNYFVFVYKQRNSGLHHINWRKTVAKKRPLIQDDDVVYMDFFTKKKEINYDEQLLVLFLSTIRHISAKYGFHIVMDSPYHLLSKNEYEQLLKDGKGLRMLRRMKNNYFNDRMVEIWRKLNVWFSCANVVGSNSSYQDFVLAKNFNIIFQDMIDDLIGDKDLPYGLKEQKDGKAIDHLFRYQSLVLNDDIYYIGDSKYYKEKDKGKFFVGDNSVYKQFTYAKNVIQYNLDVFNQRQTDDLFKYRDEQTEGYNITPNFFITGNVKPEDTMTNGRLDLDESSSDHDKFISYHFVNRLFDRDTLLLKLYNINFLFALYTYACSNSSLAEGFKANAQKQFKGDIQKSLWKKYFFFRLNIGCDLEDFVNDNFKMLNGKIFSFVEKGETFVLLALERSAKESDGLLANPAESKRTETYLPFLNRDKSEVKEREDIIEAENMRIVEQFGDIMRPYIFVENKDINFGDPQSYEKGVTSYSFVPASFDTIAAEMPSGDSDVMLVGCYKDAAHLQWILDNKLYNVRYGNRKGAIASSQVLLNPKYLLLYDFSNKNVYRYFRLNSTGVIYADSAMMREKGYPSVHGSRDYILYEITEEETKTPIDISKLIDKHAHDKEPGSPFYVKIDRETGRVVE
jgi:hypothetical protein